MLFTSVKYVFETVDSQFSQLLIYEQVEVKIQYLKFKSMSHTIELIKMFTEDDRMRHHM